MASGMPSAHAAAALVFLGEVLSAASLANAPSQVNPPWAWGRVSIPGVGPSVRENQQAAEVGDSVYIFGGCVQETRCYNDVWRLNTTRMTWVQDRYTGAAPQPRGGHTLTQVGAQLFVYGGANQEDTFGDVYRLDLERKHWSIGALAQAEWTPGRRTNHAAVADADGRMYIFGGYDFRGKFLNDLWHLKVPTKSSDMLQSEDVFAADWVKPATTGVKPSARASHSMTIIGRGVFLFGGFSAKGDMLNDVHLFDLDELDWRELRPIGGLPPPRQAHAAVRHGRELVISGGCDISAEKPECFSDVWTLSPLDLRWKERSNDPFTWMPREGHSVAFIRGKMIAFGGCMLGSECYSDVTALNTFDPCPSSCGGNGECVEGLGGAFCRCTRSGFAGHDCLQPVSCRSDCGPHGRCSQDARCTCDNGWSGEDCSVEAICPGHDTKCSGGGICLPAGTCHCLPGFSGNDCSIRGAAFLQEGSVGSSAAGSSAAGSLDGLRDELGAMYSSLLSHLRPIHAHAAQHDGAQPANSSGVAAAGVGAWATKVQGTGEHDVTREFDGVAGHGGSDKSCMNICTNHGVCRDGVCFCQPGFYGLTCSTALVVEDDSVGLTQALGIAGIAALASAVVTCLASRWGHTKRNSFDRYPHV